MGQTALVTGSAPRAGEIASALEAAGYAVTTVEDASKLDDLSLEAASVDCYVQLPVDIAPQGDNVVRVIADFLARGLLARFTSAATVSAGLAPHACVVLVAGNHPPKASTPDDQGARLALLKLLAHAILAEHHDDGVRAVIVDHGRSAGEIVELVTAPAVGQFRVIHEYAGLAPEMNYADWRLEILALSEGQA